MAQLWTTPTRQDKSTNHKHFRQELARKIRSVISNVCTEAVHSENDIEGPYFWLTQQMLRCYVYRTNYGVLSSSCEIQASTSSLNWNLVNQIFPKLWIKPSMSQFWRSNHPIKMKRVCWVKEICSQILIPYLDLVDQRLQFCIFCIILEWQCWLALHYDHNSIAHKDSRVLVWMKHSLSCRTDEQRHGLVLKFIQHIQILFWRFHCLTNTTGFMSDSPWVKVDTRL